MRTFKFLLVMLFGIAVAACGGGGGYGGGSPGGSTGYSISGTISGGVTDHSGVVVTLSGTASQSMTTAAGGVYSFTGLANGSYTVTPTRNPYTFTPTSTAVTIYNDNPTANFTESLTRHPPPGGSILAIRHQVTSPST